MRNYVPGNSTERRVAFGACRYDIYLIALVTASVIILLCNNVYIKCTYCKIMTSERSVHRLTA